jgi:hypothetical protein
MMDQHFGYATFTGILQVLSCEFTLSHGTQPSVCTLEIIPQSPDSIEPVGDLGFFYDSNTPLLLFEQCRIDQASYRYDDHGFVNQLSIQDRRWKWQFGGISGHYNLRIPTLVPPDAKPELQAALLDAQALLPVPGQGTDPGGINPLTLMSARDLAELCLDEMQEENWDASQLPDDIYPQIDWERTNPARALEDLLYSLNYTLVLRLDGSLLIAKTGVGDDLTSDLPVLSVGETVTPPLKPSAVTVVFAPSRYNVHLLLEAVGKDTCGAYVPINELSYRPQTNWGYQHPPFFSGVDGWDNAELFTLFAPVEVQIATAGQINPKALAQETVFRTYRVKMEDVDGSGKPPLIPGWFGGDADANREEGSRIRYLWQILPLLDEQVAGFVDQVDHKWHAWPPWIWGEFYDGNAYLKNQTNGLMTYGFRFVPEQGLVVFDDYVFRYVGDAPNQTIAPAILTLRVAVTVRDEETRGVDRYSKTVFLPEPDFGTADRIIMKEDHCLSVMPDYVANSQVESVDDNSDDLDQEADYYLNAFQLEMQPKDAKDVTYVGIWPVDLDGAIRQVTFMVGPRGHLTRASLNYEYHPLVPSYEERRQLGRLNDLLDTVDGMGQGNEKERLANLAPSPA